MKAKIDLKQVNENLNLEVRKDANEKKFAVRLTAIVCSTILGIIGMIGAFWGDTGLQAFGLVVLLIAFITIWANDNANGGI